MQSVFFVNPMESHEFIKRLKSLSRNGDVLIYVVN